MKHMKEGEKISQIFIGVGKHGENLYARGRVTSKEEGIRKMLERAKKLFSIDTTKEKDAAKEFVDEAKKRGQQITESKKGWSSEHRYTKAPGKTQQEYLANMQVQLDKVKDVLQALHVSANPELTQIVGPIDPNTLQSSQAAEFLARLAVVPQSLREDPNYLFSEAAKLVGSKDQFLPPLAQQEIDELVYKTMDRIRQLRTPTNFVLEDEEMRYAFRGFTLRDDRFDGPFNPTGDPEMAKIGRVLDEQKKQIQTFGPNRSIENRINAFKGLQHHLEKGEDEEMYFDARTGRNKKSPVKFDRSLAQKYIDRYTQHINDLEQQLEIQRSLVGWEPATADEAMRGIASHLSRERSSTITNQIYKTVYEGLPKDEKEQFLKLVKARIREAISSLERQSIDRWDPTGIRSKEQELGSWIEYSRHLDPEVGKLMAQEEESRRWHHMLIKTLETGISPMDTKRLEAIQNEFDQNQFLESIARVPGVDRGVQLIEENWEGYFRSETNPAARGVWKQHIIQTLENEGVCTDGITPEVAYELSMRHLKAFGREGMMYNEFIEKYDLIKIRKDPDTGLWKAFVDRNAPLTWDPMRLIYCPKAMWIYFGFGGDEAGQPVSFKTLDGKTMSAVGGRGVGAEVMKVLFDSGLDFRIQDFYSRRKPHILDAWISEQLEKPGARPDDRAAWGAYIEELKNDKYDPATGVITRPGDPLLANVYELQLKVIKAEYGVRFAGHFHEQVWETPDGARILDQVQKLKNTARGRPSLIVTLDRIERDFPSIITETNRINTAINPNWKTDPKFKDYFKSMAGFHIKDVPFRRLPRLQEAVRGNFRDTFTALAIYGGFGGLINDPTASSLLQIPVDKAIGYTSRADIQSRMVVPGYNAVVAVQRGHGTFGSDTFFGIRWPGLNSKYGTMYEVAPETDRELLKLTKALVAKKYLDKAMAYKLRGEFLGRVGDLMLLHVDPEMLGFVFFEFVVAELQQIMKDQQKEG